MRVRVVESSARIEMLRHILLQHSVHVLELLPRLRPFILHLYIFVIKQCFTSFIIGTIFDLRVFDATDGRAIIGFPAIRNINKLFKTIF
jgi:hypothetical protein